LPATASTLPRTATAAVSFRCFVCFECCLPLSPAVRICMSLLAVPPTHTHTHPNTCTCTICLAYELTWECDGIQRCVDFANPQQKHQVVMQVVDQTVVLVQDAFGTYFFYFVYFVQQSHLPHTNRARKTRQLAGVCSRTHTSKQTSGHPRLSF